MDELHYEYIRYHTGAGAQHVEQLNGRGDGSAALDLAVNMPNLDLLPVGDAFVGRNTTQQNELFPDFDSADVSRIPLTVLAAGNPDAAQEASWRYFQGELVPGGKRNPEAEPLPGAFAPHPIGTAQPHGQQIIAGVADVPKRQFLVLFNVIVGMEWTPTPDQQRQLEWSFRRASNVLYDISDGQMAFGQVVFGGTPYIKGCDIQLMASSRYQPRSWVDASEKATKSMPIRLGRGYWNQRNRVVTAWDEHEAARIIVHEWAHYALALRDAYLENVLLTPLSDEEPGVLLRNAAGRGYDAVLQRLRDPSDSIMASLAGTSELVLHREAGDEWDTVVEKFSVGTFQLRRPTPTVSPGPGELPLPLPVFRWRTTPNAARRAHPRFPGQAEQPAFWSGIEALGILPSHCSVYLLRDGEQDAGLRLLAQGTLDDRTKMHGFDLLGAQDTDRVIIDAWTASGKGYSSPANLSVSTLTQPWTLREAGFSPEVRVIPKPGDAGDARTVPIHVRITSDRQPTLAWLQTIDEQHAHKLTLRHLHGESWESQPLPVTTLDGYVVLEYHEDQERHYDVTTFSQGGGPPSGGVFVPASGAPVPITGGSSDGTIMLYFSPPAEAEQDDIDKFSDVRIVTTINNGAGRVPGTQLPHDKAKPYSYPFAVAGTKAMPAECRPTLVVSHDGLDEQDAFTGTLRMCRLEGNSWTVLPTHAPAGQSFAAVPLTAAIVPQLFEDSPAPVSFQLFWIPR